MTTLVSFHEGPSGCEVMLYCGEGSAKTKYRFQYAQGQVIIHRFDSDDGWVMMMGVPYKQNKELPGTFDEIFRIKGNDFVQRNLLITFVDQIVESTDVIIQEILKEKTGIVKSHLRKMIRKTLLNHYDGWSAVEAI